MPSHRSIGSREALATLLALVALLQPTFTPLAPDLAGWLPSHGHIYRDGVPVPHSHPGDAAASLPSLIRHLHGAPHLLPAAVPKTGETTTADTEAPQDSGAAVVFTFENIELFASVMPPSPQALPACPQAIAVTVSTAPTRLALVAVAPIPRPPQA